MTDISEPFLHTIKCSDCNLYIDIRTLNNHQCEKSKIPVFNSRKAGHGGGSIRRNDKTDIEHTTIQRRLKEKAGTNAFNIGMKKILQKMKGNEHQEPCLTINDRDTAASFLSSRLSPTLSTFTMSTASTSSVTTPRSSNNDNCYRYDSHFSDRYDPDFNYFKLQGRNKELFADNSKKKNELDDIYSELLLTMNMKEDMCSLCYQIISMNDESVKDLKSRKLYHKSCFCCTLCRIPLSSASACEFNNKLFCPRDYQVMNARALKNKTMPKMCFHCKRELKEGEAFKTYKNRIYCHDDFVQLFAPKCRSCHQPVENEAVSAMDGKLEGKWHMACFNCQICHEPFPDNTFYVFDHQPYCKKHYHLLNNSLCSRCHEGIENLCALTAEGWRFHPSCFTCEVCQQRLGDTYYVFENRIYCEEHIQRQLGKNNQNNSHSNNSQLLDKRRTQIYNMQSNKA